MEPAGAGEGAEFKGFLGAAAADLAAISPEGGADVTVLAVGLELGAGETFWLMETPFPPVMLAA